VSSYYLCYAVAACASGQEAIRNGVGDPPFILVVRVQFIPRSLPCALHGVTHILILDGLYLLASQDDETHYRYHVRCYLAGNA
jgi:hypothetical protein